MTGIDLVHVPYKGAAPATTDVVGGQVQLHLRHHWRRRAAHRRRKAPRDRSHHHQASAVLPDVPTIAEAGLPGYELDSWQAIIAPGRKPPETTRKLNQASRPR